MKRITRVKKLISISLIFVFVFALFPVSRLVAQAKFFEKDRIHEKDFEANWDKEIIAYGNALNEDEREETFKLLGVKNKEDFQFVEITELDVWPYVDALFVSNISSIRIRKTEVGTGIRAHVITPDNILVVEDHEYTNSAITSGITDCEMIIASCKEVTGVSALAGAYKIFNLIEKDSVNDDEIKLSIKELNVIKSIKEDLGMDLKPSKKTKESKETLETSEGGDVSEGAETSESVATKETKSKNDRNPNNVATKKITDSILEIKQTIADLKERSGADKTLDEEEILALIGSVFDKSKIELSDRSKRKLLKWVDEFQNADLDWQRIQTGMKQFVDNKILEKSGQHPDDDPEETSVETTIDPSKVKKFIDKEYSLKNPGTNAIPLHLVVLIIAAVVIFIAAIVILIFLSKRRK